MNATGHSGNNEECRNESLANEPDVITLSDDDDVVPISKPTDSTSCNGRLRTAYDSDSPNDIGEDGEDQLIEIVDIADNEDLVDSDSQELTCPTCFPFTPHTDNAQFKDRSSYDFHRQRHFAPDHFMCPICRKGFVKLNQCLSHEAKVHNQSAETPTSSVAYTLANTAIYDTGLSSKSSEDETDHIVTSTSLYSYRGPLVKSYYDTYAIQSKYGHPNSTVTEWSKSIMNWRLKSGECKKLGPKRRGRPKRDTYTANNREQTRESSDSDKEKDDHGSYSGFHKRKRSTVNKLPPNEAEQFYSCKVCSFTGKSKQEFSKHREAKHPEFLEEKILEFFTLTALGSAVPQKKAVKPKKKKRRILPTSTHDAFPPLPPPPPPEPDTSTAVGFLAGLGLVQNLTTT